jgi:CRISPR/Cas system endoribonuclease Cas6 (RAMP superfamily)
VRASTSSKWQRSTSKKMKLGGFVGEVGFEGEGLPEFLPLVPAGEILHVGTGTSFGLGRYRIMA